MARNSGRKASARARTARAHSAATSPSASSLAVNAQALPLRSTAIARSAFPLGALMLAASVGSWAQGAPAGSGGTGGAAAVGTLGTVTVTDQAEVQGKDALQTKKTNIGKGTQDIRDIPQSINVITEKLIDDAQARHAQGGAALFGRHHLRRHRERHRPGHPPARLSGRHGGRPADRRHARPVAVRPRHLQPRPHRSAARLGLDAVRPRLDRRRDQPGDQEAAARGPDRRGRHASVRDGYFRSTVDFNKRTGEDSAFRLNAMVHQAPTTSGAKIDKQGIAPSYSWGIGTRDEFTVGAFYLDVDNVPHAGRRYLSNGTFANGIAQSSIANIRPGNFYGADSDYVRGKRDIRQRGLDAHLRRRRRGAHAVRSGTFERSQWSSTASFCNVAPTLTGACPAGGSGDRGRPDALHLRAAQRPGAAQGRIQRHLRAERLQQELRRGRHEARDDRRRRCVARKRPTASAPTVRSAPTSTRAPRRVGTPDDGYETAVGAVLPRRPATTRRAAFGAYVQDLVQVAPDWKLLGGVRCDRFSGDFSQTAYRERQRDDPERRHPHQPVGFALQLPRRRAVPADRRRSPTTCRTARRSTPRPTPTST